MMVSEMIKSLESMVESTEFRTQVFDWCSLVLDTNSFVLNFGGRVHLASVKNFQIVHENDCKFCSISGSVRMPSCLDAKVDLS
jgi:hypothetical protein